MGEEPEGLSRHLTVPASFYYYLAFIRFMPELNRTRNIHFMDISLKLDDDEVEYDGC